MKAFLITVDTEGDNQWQWEPERPITTENAKYISRFQALCETYSWKPVYLINYEMAQSDELVHALKDKAEKNLCEIGMHLHAWNSPPNFELPIQYHGCPYITEYPKQVVYEKHKFLREYITRRFGQTPVSYRAGRWATNRELFEVLEELGFLVDCSETPQLSHAGLCGMSVNEGPDYSHASVKPHKICRNLIEVPMTTRHKRSLQGKTFKNKAGSLIKGKPVWLRPAVQTVQEMVRLIHTVEREGVDYAEFMIHSSELMPGGSPYFKDGQAIERLYKCMDELFSYVSQEGYIGLSLAEYARQFKE